MARFIAIVSSYLQRGGIDRSADPVLAGRASADALVLRVATEHFMMGHEYGHLILGHLGKRKKTRVDGQDGADPVVVSEIRSNYSEEHEADAWGLTLGILAGRFGGCSDETRGCLGAAVFFMVDLLLSRSVNIALGRDADDWSSFTHPPAMERYQFIRERICMVIPEANAEVALNHMDGVCKIMWALMAGWEEWLGQAISKGEYRLAAHWT